MCQIKLDFVQNSEEADYVLKNDNVFPGATNKNVASGQNEVISYAREVVETLRYPNLSLHNDEVTLELVKKRVANSRPSFFKKLIHQGFFESSLSQFSNFWYTITGLPFETGRRLSFCSLRS